MRYTKRQEIITSPFIIQEMAEPQAFDDGQSESRDLRFHELDEEYRHQLTHLKRIAREAKHSFMGSSSSNISRKAR
jgi:hypothetical protein